MGLGRSAVRVLVALLGFGLACGGAASRGGPLAARPEEPRRESPFPSPKALEELTREHAVPEGLFDGRFVDVDSWTLTGPFPARIAEEAISDPDPWERALLEAARRRAGLVVVSQAMRCAAREFGRFVSEHAAMPGQSLRRYVMGRCGATGVGFQFGTLRGRVPPDSSDERVLEAWREQLDASIRKYMGTGPRAVGIWFGRRGEEGLVLVVSAARRVLLEPASATPQPDGSIHLRGEVLSPAQEIAGHINRGRYGFAACEVDRSVTLPRFELHCPAQRGDAVAWISVGARPPGRLLADSVLLALARPAAGEATTWRRASYGRSRRVAEPEQFRQWILREVNRIRERAGMGLLAFESRESETAARLAPFYFGSQLGMLEPGVGDLVALGLMAGWQVGGVIRDAGMGGVIALDTRDLDRWLAEALEQPGMRAVLLDPARSRLAVGPIVSDEHDYLAAVVASYELYGDEDPGDLREEFYARLNREFDARGLRFPRRDRDVEVAAARQLARVQAGAITPDAAVGELLEESVVLMRARVRGWHLEGSSPQDVELPDELFASPPGRIAAAVGHYQPEGWPWGRSVVLLVVTPQSPLRTARAHGDVPETVTRGTLLAADPKSSACPAMAVALVSTLRSRSRETTGAPTAAARRDGFHPPRHGTRDREARDLPRRSRPQRLRGSTLAADP